MKARLQRLIKEWAPPALLRAIKPATYSFIAYEWPQNTQIPGWKRSSVSAAREKAWNKFIMSMNGTSLLGISEKELLSPYAVNTDTQNLYLAFGYCLSLASHDKKNLTVLDWGGGTGNYYVVARKLIPAVELDYYCADLKLVCEAGRKLLPEAVFYDDDKWRDLQYDFVFSSSSLQYLEDWRPTLKALVQSSNRYMFITRMPFVMEGRSFVMLQRVKEYGTEYFGWVINRREFVRHVEKQGMRLVREFVNHPGPRIKGAPEQNLYMGFLFEK